MADDDIIMGGGRSTRGRGEGDRLMPNRDPITKKFLPITPENPGVWIRRGGGGKGKGKEERKSKYRSKERSYFGPTHKRGVRSPGGSSGGGQRAKRSRDEVTGEFISVKRASTGAHARARVASKPASTTPKAARIAAGHAGSSSLPKPPIPPRPKARRTHVGRKYKATTYPDGCAEGSRFVCRPKHYNRSRQKAK